MSEVRTERTDLDIENDIERIITHYPPLTQDRHNIDVTVQNGVVTLTGHTRTGITSRYLIDAVHKVPGVVRVEADKLYSDGIVRLEIARLLPFGVIANVMYGVVILTGQKPEGVNEADLISSIASVPGVRAVRTQFA
jgi:osmotically-inducible protein OsmY